MKLMLPIVQGSVLIACSSPPEGEFSRAEKMDAHRSAELALQSAVCRQRLKTLRELHDRMQDAQTPAARDELVSDFMRSDQVASVPAEADGDSARETSLSCSMDMIDMKIRRMMSRDAAKPAAK